MSNAEIIKPCGFTHKVMVYKTREDKIGGLHYDLVTSYRCSSKEEALTRVTIYKGDIANIVSGEPGFEEFGALSAIKKGDEIYIITTDINDNYKPWLLIRQTKKRELIGVHVSRFIA